MDNREQTKPAPYGVGGWLLLLVVLMLAIGPLFALKDMAIAYAIEMRNPALALSPQWVELRGWLYAFGALGIATSVGGGLVLAFSRQRSALDWVKATIWSQPILALIAIASSYEFLGPDGTIQPSIFLVVGVSYAAIWHAYLNGSARVKATYTGSTTTPTPAAPKVPPPLGTPNASIEARATAPDRNVAAGITPPGIRLRGVVVTESPETTELPSDDAWYEQALEELENGQAVKATWARSLAEAYGDEAKARGAYIRLRVPQIGSAHEADQVAKAETERVAQAAKTEADRVAQAHAEQVAKVKADRLQSIEADEREKERKRRVQKDNKLAALTVCLLVVVGMAIFLFTSNQTTPPAPPPAASKDAATKAADPTRKASAAKTKVESAPPKKNVEKKVASTTPKSREVTFSDGKYIGGLKDGKQHGRGTFIWPNGDRYVGDWIDGRRTGQGVYTFSDGDKYVGEFKDNAFHGYGVFHPSSADKYYPTYDSGYRAGLWVNGNFVEVRR